MFFTLVNVISIAFSIYSFMLIAYILMSWVPAIQDTPIGRILEKLCEPYLGIFRKFIPPIGMIDFSPIIAIIVLRFIANGVFIVLEKLYFLF